MARTATRISHSGPSDPDLRIIREGTAFHSLGAAAAAIHHLFCFFTEKQPFCFRREIAVSRPSWSSGARGAPPESARVDEISLPRWGRLSRWYKRPKPVTRRFVSAS
jgi:hypothetical protein